MKKLLTVAAGFLLITVLILVGLDFFASRQRPSLVSQTKEITQPTSEKKEPPQPVPEKKADLPSAPSVSPTKEVTQEPGVRSSVSDQETALSATPIPSANSNQGTPREPTVRAAQIKLLDGSRIVGDIFLDKLKIRSSYGDLALDMKDLVAITNNRVKMRDGNVFTGDFLTKTIRIKTKHGDVDVDLDKVAALNAQPENPTAEEAEEPDAVQENVTPSTQEAGESRVVQEKTSSSPGKEKKSPSSSSELSEQSPPSEKENNVVANVSDKASPSKKEKKSLKGVVNIKTGSLNVREGEGETFKVITRLKKGDEVEILDASDEWYKLKLPDGRTGYAAARFIKPQE